MVAILEETMEAPVAMVKEGMEALEVTARDREATVVVRAVWRSPGILLLHNHRT
jgi:2-keto-3-deoxy-6-phosphogluconate aldolase